MCVRVISYSLLKVASPKKCKKIALFCILDSVILYWIYLGELIEATFKNNYQSMKANQYCYKKNVRQTIFVHLAFQHNQYC